MSRGGGQGVNATGGARRAGARPYRNEGLEVTLTHGVLRPGSHGAGTHDGPAPTATPPHDRLHELPALIRSSIAMLVSAAGDLDDHDRAVLANLSKVLQSGGTNVPPRAAEVLQYAVALVLRVPQDLDAGGQ